MAHLSMRNTASKPNLENRYVFICAGSNVSDPLKVCADQEARRTGNGLTDEGKAQVKEAAARLMSSYKTSHKDLILVTSDYKDASETTSILASELGTGTPKVSSMLRERSFGRFEGESLDSLVPLLFAKDQKDPGTKTNGAESVIEVMTRTGKLVAQLEHEHKGQVIVIVGHSGVLQILQTAFIGTKPHHFRQISALVPGETREMPHSAAQATLPRNPRQYKPTRPSAEGMFPKASPPS